MTAPIHLQAQLLELRAAVEAQPREPGLRSNLAGLLSHLGEHQAAVSEADRALELDPDCAAALYNQASSLLALGDAKAACDRLNRYSALVPDDARAYNNLGLALAADQRYEDALAAFDRALAVTPEYPRAFNNRAAVLMKLQRFDAALQNLERALSIDSEYVQAHLNRGAALRALGRHESALAAYQNALPALEALANITDILTKDPHRTREALQFATELYRRAPERDNVLGTHHAASQSLAHWADYESRVAAIVTSTRAGRVAATPFRMLYLTDSPEDQLVCARAAARGIPKQEPLWQGQVYLHERIRVAYLSSDYYSHATSHLTAGLFEHHDRKRFECFALSHGEPRTGDAMRGRLERAFEHFEDVHPVTAAQIAARVRQLQIDILVDLKGYTADSRIEVLSYRAAPVQVHYLGYPGTLGAQFVDYLVADEYVIPGSSEHFYSEKIARLPHTYQVTDDRRAAASTDWTRERAGLPPAALVLAAFHQTYKLNPIIFASWMRLLGRLPNACLWLLERNPHSRPQLLSAASAAGVDPSRLIFAPDAVPEEHIGRQRLADLLLDTWPYGSHTTASDALWAGLPVVALSGRSFASRVSGSILRAAGLGDLVCDTLAGYEEKVLEICGSADRLRTLRARVESKVRSTPLFDTALFTRQLEGIYTQMHARHQAGLPPATLGV